MWKMGKMYGTGTAYPFTTVVDYHTVVVEGYAWAWVK